MIHVVLKVSEKINRKAHRASAAAHIHEVGSWSWQEKKRESGKRQRVEMKIKTHIGWWKNFSHGATMLYFPVGQMEIVFLVVAEALPAQLALARLTCLIAWSIHANFGTHRQTLLVSVHVLLVGVTFVRGTEEKLKSHMWKIVFQIISK